MSKPSGLVLRLSVGDEVIVGGDTRLTFRTLLQDGYARPTAVLVIARDGRPPQEVRLPRAGTHRLDCGVGVEFGRLVDRHRGSFLFQGPRSVPILRAELVGSAAEAVIAGGVRTARLNKRHLTRGVA